MTMTHRASVLILSMTLIAFITFKVASANCSTYTNCLDCSSAPSWSGSCRWCPVDSLCHAAGAIFVNPCKSSQNIVDPAKCPSSPTPQTAYNDKFGWDALMYSYAAYATENGAVAVEKSYLPTSFSAVGSPFAFDIPFSLASSCLGYLGIDNTKRQVVVSFRGTLFGKMTDLFVEQLLSEVLNAVVDLFAGGYQVWPDMPDVKVAHYYAKAAPLLVAMTQPALDLIKKNPTYTVLVTGHSLGGSLASIMAANLVRELNSLKLNSSNVMLITFGQPRVGNEAYAKYIDRVLSGRSFRVVANRDIVPSVPPVKAGALHHGTEIWYAAGGYFQDKVPCKYRECTNGDEDDQCSNSLIVRLSIADHIHRYWCALPMGFCNPTLAAICPS